MPWLQQRNPLSGYGTLASSGCVSKKRARKNPATHTAGFFQHALMAVCF
jgi:hypothetical protein